MLHDNAGATSSPVVDEDQFHLDALKQSLARVERLLQAAQARRMTDLCDNVAALALSAAVGADSLRGEQQSRPGGRVLVCFDGVRVGLMPARERARLAALDERDQLVDSQLGAARAATMLRAVQVIVAALRAHLAGLRGLRPFQRRQWRHHSAGVEGRVECAYLLSYVPRELLPRLHVVTRDYDWYFSLEYIYRYRTDELRRAVKHWCNDNPAFPDPSFVPAPLPCPGSSFLQRLADLTPASLSVLVTPSESSLGGTQPVTAHLPIHEAQAPPTMFGWSGTSQEMRDAVIAQAVVAQAAREEARVDEYYAAREAAAEIAAGFDPGFASAIYASFGVGDAAVGRAPWGGLVEAEGEEEWGGGEGEDEEGWDGGWEQ